MNNFYLLIGFFTLSTLSSAQVTIPRYQADSYYCTGSTPNETAGVEKVDIVIHMLKDNSVNKSELTAVEVIINNKSKKFYDYLNPDHAKFSMTDDSNESVYIAPTEQSELLIIRLNKTKLNAVAFLDNIGLSTPVSLTCIK